MPDNTILLDYGQRVPAPAIDGYVRSLASGQWWNGSGTEDFLLSHWTNYAVPLIEVGGAGATGLFLFVVPAALPIDSWDIVFRARVGTNASAADSPCGADAFGWDGAKIGNPYAGGGGVFGSIQIEPAPPAWAQPSSILGPWIFHEGDQWEPISEALNLPSMPDLSGCLSSFVMTEETCAEEVVRSSNVTVTMPTTVTFQQTNEFVKRGVYNYGWDITRGDGKKFFATAGPNRQIVILPKL